MKKIPLIFTIIVFVIFQFLHIGVWNLPFPGLQQDRTDLLVNARTPDCTEIGFPKPGFPFRNNLYDYCKQDPKTIWWVQLVNWSLQISILVLVFITTKKTVNNIKR